MDPQRPTASPLKGAMFQYALALVRALHWLVFPVRQILDTQGSPYCDCKDPSCKDVGKHPRIPWSKDATNDEGRVLRLWERFPNDGIGVATGEKSNIWVLDVDPRAGGIESLASLEKEHGMLPKTITVRTGSLGVHYMFKYPGPEYRNSAGLLGKGLDTRGDGGYVVTAPSLHKSGRRYGWIKGPADAELADAPSWLLTLAKTTGTKTVGARDGAGAKEKQGLHAAAVPRSEAGAQLETMLEHPLVTWMIEYPDDVDRETWRGVAQNLACAVSDHADLVEAAAAAFHELSEDYSGYSWSETERVFRESVVSAQNVGPMSFAYMAQCGAPVEHLGTRATNLIHAARLILRARRGGVR